MVAIFEVDKLYEFFYISWTAVGRWDSKCKWEKKFGKVQFAPGALDCARNREKKKKNMV